MSERLDTASIEAIAQRVVELLRADGIGRDLVDAAEIARRYGRTRGWVYDHAAELGAIELGGGDRPRLAFDPAQVEKRLSNREAPAETRPTAPARRPVRRSGDLLPIGGSKP